MVHDYASICTLKLNIKKQTQTRFKFGCLIFIKDNCSMKWKLRIQIWKRVVYI